MRLGVWAPRATVVEIEFDEGERVRLDAADEPGWFDGDVPQFLHGARYWLVLDDGDRLPDPLTRRMPDGVHASSQLWDPSSYRWHDAGWTGRELSARTSVMYELHVGTFTSEGTLDAAIGRLGHLESLGVSHVELMPLSAFDGPRGWGYDGVALNAVHEAYGGPDALCRFVDAAHARGLAVVLDVVQNHLGPSGNYWNRFGPLFTDAHTTPWGAALNLDDVGSDDVRGILLGSALSWLREFHLDGLRLDAVHALKDERALTFLEELSAQVEELAAAEGRSLILVAESDRNDPRTVTPRASGGIGLTAQWDDDLHHALHWLFTGETNGYYADFGSLDAVATALSGAFLHDGRLSSFRGRRHGRPVDFQVTPPWRFVAALQTHDQVGNRAQGDRMSQLVDVDRLAAAAAVLLTLPYTPMLFMGEEWGASTPWQFFSSFSDPELARAVTRGRRREFAAYGWATDDVPDPQAESTFRRSTLDWTEADGRPHADLLSWYRDLIALRAEIAGGDPPVCLWGEDLHGDPSWFATRSGSRVAIGNLTNDEICVDLGWGPLVVALAWNNSVSIDVGSGRARVQPGGSAVLEVLEGE